MHVKNNQRSQLTQNRIKDVFIKMLGTKDIKKITIQDICREADVNRTTFYSHFDDIYDLMKKIEIEMWQGVSSLMQKESNRTNNLLDEKTLENLIEFIFSNANFYRVYLNDFNVSKTIDTLWEQSAGYFVVNHRKKSKTEQQYRFEFFKSGMIGTIRMWLNSNCQQSPMEIAQILKSYISLI